MSVFSEEKEFSFADHRKQVKSIRKLIPRRSKVFPKDFFPLENDEISPSKKIKTDLSSPRTIEIINPISKRHFSERQVHFEENLIQDELGLNRHFLFEKPNTPKAYSGDEDDQKPKGERVLRNILNINLASLVLERKKQNIRLTKKFPSDNIEKAKTAQKQKLSQPNSFRSATAETDENVPQYKIRSDLQDSRVVISEMQKTPMFKEHNNFPVIKENQQISSHQSKRIILNQGKDKLSTPQDMPLNLKPMMKRLNIPPKEQRNIRKNDLIGISPRLMIKDTKSTVSKKVLLSSIIKLQKPTLSSLLN